VSIRAILYASLGALLLASILVEVLGHVFGWSWTDTWMPNFIAEWSGILLAVLVVDRLLETDRERRETERISRLRESAGVQLHLAIGPLVGCAEALGWRVLAEDFEPDYHEMSPRAARLWQNAITRALDGLEHFVSDYGEVLEPDDRLSIIHLRDSLASSRAMAEDDGIQAMMVCVVLRNSLPIPPRLWKAGEHSFLTWIERYKERAALRDV
jgi:hypothetical protein